MAKTFENRKENIENEQKWQKRASQFVENKTLTIKEVMTYSAILL
jgi:hypothetical protein